MIFNVKLEQFSLRTQIKQINAYFFNTPITTEINY